MMKIKLLTAGLVARWLPALLIVSILSIWLTESSASVEQAKNKNWEAITEGDFAKSLLDAQKKHPSESPPYPQFNLNQIVHIAENLLVTQNADGGWPRNQDWLRVGGPRAKLPDSTEGTTQQSSSTLDNWATWSQIGYLARVYQKTGLIRYANSATKGITYLLDHQKSSGGWSGADVDAITYNDRVMAGVMKTLKQITTDRQLYKFVTNPLLRQARAALDKGLNCILNTQILQDGQLTVWGQQHDHQTYEPVWARSFEPPALVSTESVDVVEFLMSIQDPSSEVIRSVQSAISWFESVKIQGVRIEKTAIPPVIEENERYDFDYIVIRDPAAEPIWTRYYDLQTGQPLFSNRGRKQVKRFQDLSLERRVGYRWYNYAPANLLLSAYPEWQKRWGINNNVLNK